MFRGACLRIGKLFYLAVKLALHFATYGFTLNWPFFIGCCELYNVPLCACIIFEQDQFVISGLKCSTCWCGIKWLQSIIYIAMVKHQRIDQTHRIGTEQYLILIIAQAYKLYTISCHNFVYKYRNIYDLKCALIDLHIENYIQIIFKFIVLMS